MYRENPLPLPPPPPANFAPPPPPPSPSKADTQRSYREKEGRCFDRLRYLIKQLTGEELQTRHEILTKVIELFSSVSETRRQEQARVDPAIEYQPLVPVPNTADPTSTYLDHPQFYSQAWENAYYMQGQSDVGGQQYCPDAYVDHTFQQSYYEESGEGWRCNAQL